MGVNENVYGQFGQIALKIYCSDLVELQRTAEAIQAVIATVPGVADLGIVKSAPVPQLQLRPQRELLGRFGLSMTEVQHFISVAIGGSPVGTFWEGERSFDVVLRLPESVRDTLDKISALRIPTKSGAPSVCGWSGCPYRSRRRLALSLSLVTLARRGLLMPSAARSGPPSQPPP